MKNIIDMSWRKYLRVVHPIDLITLAYILLTGIFIVCSAFKLTNIGPHILIRFGIAALIGVLIFLDSKVSNGVVHFLRNFYPLGLLGYFYPETDYLNNVFFPNLDPWIVNLEETIFNGQPSIWFSQYMPWKWFNDLMNFGYFSYYFLIFMVCYMIYKHAREHFQFTIFVICMSFYMYYIIFMLFPVAGPQFYFTPPDNQLPDAYIFRDAVKFVHDLGERPTAAFPSSHVGIGCLLLYLAGKYRPKMLNWLIPAVVLLILSTVYIKAHYVMDVIAGLFTVPTMYWISSRTFHAIEHGWSQEHKVQFICEKLFEKVGLIFGRSKKV